MEKKSPYPKKKLIISSTTILNIGNIRSRAVYAKGRATRGNILKIFGTYLINSDLWFHTLNFVSQINL